jgi:hypothetical protein
VIALVSPAYRRFELSAVVFDQRLDLMRSLGAKGIEVRQIVVADDANLDLARERGFTTIEAPNVVSDRFNAGMGRAGEMGADWIVPIGSDSWLDPHYLTGLYGGVVRTSEWYCHVTAERLGEARVRRRPGAGPYVIARRYLEPVGFRPAKPGLMRHVDSSTIAGLAGAPRFGYFHRHPFQYVGFRVAPYITSYASLMKAWGVREHDDPWTILGRHYPADLVERARRVMTS